MIAGDPSVFAIESSFTAAYSRLSFMAIGYFNIILHGRRYGVQDPEATMLACSFDEVGRRILNRGKHIFPFFEILSGSEIAGQFRRRFYTDISEHNVNDDDSFDKYGDLYSKNIVWAPDGDSAFDDSSYVLQFDINDTVRLVGFKSCVNLLFDPETLNDVFLNADDFYRILKEWHSRFFAEWNALPKLND